MCSRPSRPPRSMEAPKSVMFLTMPFGTWFTDGAFLVLEVLEEDLDLVALFEALRILELVDRHRAFRLEADVEDDGSVGHAQNFGFDDFAFFDIRKRPLIQQSHFGDLVGGIFLVETGAD